MARIPFVIFQWYSARSGQCLMLPVDIQSERGLLGIAILGDDTVFLYFTENGQTLRNRVYRYNWNGESLINATLILDLPAIPGPNHNAGKLIIGPDHYLYVIIGDLNHDGRASEFSRWARA